MSRFFVIVWVLLAAMFVMGAGGCAGGDDSGDYEEAWGLDASAPAAAPAMQHASLEGANAGVTLQMKDNAESDASMTAPTPPPAPSAPASADASDESGAPKVQASPQVQTRVIVHTAYMSLVVGDIAGSVDWITGLAAALGGWVVSSDRTSLHGGAVSFRVPAASLEDALSQLEGMAVEVESRTITSQDVTDQYVDYQSRLVSMKATEQRLLSFLDEATDVEDALEVHKELAELQVVIEEIQGRINFLEQTSAFSLIEVSLRLTPQAIQVDAGEDMAVRVGRNARFRASFAPPEGIDEYQFTWDFGDGTSAGGSGTILRPDGRRVTATVNHVYEDDLDSPYIARIELSGFGESGVAEGEDALEVVVSEVPSIEVFAGEGQTVKEGQEAEFNASFLRPEGLWDYSFTWDFGDGSSTVTGEPQEGATRLQATHVYSDHRPQGYEVVLTVSAMSDGGEVKASGSIWVNVTESQGLIVGGWNLGETASSAVRALSVVARGALMALIWAGIFSPVIALVVAILYFGPKIDRRLRRGGKKSSQPPVAPKDDETTG